MSRILIAEDESRISSFIDKGLTAAGFSTVIVESGPDALAHATSGRYDLLVLDIGLPGIDGYEVMRHIRAAGVRIPVVVLTARTSAEDTLASLEGGANDYMPKPFRFDELLARVRLRLNDASTVGGATLRVEGLELDLRTRRALVGGRQVELSAREFALAEELMRNPDRVLSREQLLSRVWGYDFDPGSNIVDVYIGYL
ncbi:MAG: two-component system, OmpR family, copper resistance phosphate regulon response regulator CusR, partial [Actinomycetota bacterium]|nr:two-component system, OmpR family, copper resistance phosphate regulon response regulator CusR [Actinomycetota bacterium]